MKKNQIRGIIVFGVILAAYLVLALLIPFERTDAYWIGFGFGILELIMGAIGIIIAFKGAESAKSRFYGFPIARIAVILALIQVAVSFVLMGLGKIVPVWVGLIVCILIFVAMILGLVATDATRDDLERQDEVLIINVKTMRSFQSKAKMLVNHCSEPETKKKVDELAEEFRFSDPVSSDATIESENQIASLLDELEVSILDADSEGTIELVSKLSGVLKERNRLCKLNK